MKISALVILMTLSTMAHTGCGGGNATSTSDARKAPEAFALDGAWIYLGPWDGEHNLTISDDSVKYAGLNDEWESRWALKKYDNQLSHFQMTFDSGKGSYFPSGTSFSGSYVLTDAILTVQLGGGLDAYPPVKSPGSCTDENAKPIVDCRLYMKQPPATP